MGGDQAADVLVQAGHHGPILGELPLDFPWRARPGRQQLIADEHLAVGVRKSLLAWFWPISLAIIFLLLPFFLIFPLFNFGLNGIIVFSLMLIFSFSYRNTNDHMLNRGEVFS